MITDELIEEHRTTFGKRRSDALERVLTYFRSAGVADKYAVLAVKPFAEYRIVALSGRYDQIQLTDFACLGRKAPIRFRRRGGRAGDRRRRAGSQTVDNASIASGSG